MTGGYNKIGGPDTKELLVAAKDLDEACTKIKKLHPNANDFNNKTLGEISYQEYETIYK